MKLINSYVLEVPDLGYMLKQEEVERFELFLLTAKQGCRKVTWKTLPGNGSLVFLEDGAANGPLKAARIDFKSNRIIFYRGKLSELEFEDFIQYLIQALFLRINPDQMHFLAMPAIPKTKK